MLRNPRGSLTTVDRDLSVEFGDFTRYLERDGFTVVECHSLTSRGKNAADIRIVIDAMNMMSGPYSSAEIIIASGDSDFLPLVEEARRRGLTTTLVSTYPNTTIGLINSHSSQPCGPQTVDPRASMQLLADSHPFR